MVIAQNHGHKEDTLLIVSLDHPYMKEFGLEMGRSTVSLVDPDDHKTIRITALAETEPVMKYTIDLMYRKLFLEPASNAAYAKSENIELRSVFADSEMSETFCLRQS